MYGDTITIVKISILLHHLRIFAPIRKMNLLYLGSWGIIWSMTVFFTIATFLSIFGCTPREKLWNILITTGHCINIECFDIAAGVMVSISDILILLLAQHSIWKLQRTWKSKFAISMVFLTGAL